MDLGHHDRDDGKWDRHAGHFADHPLPDHLGFDLPETGLDCDAASVGRHQDAGRPQQRIDDIAWPQDELFDPAIDAGIDSRLGQFNLCLLERRLGACLLGR